MGFSLAVGDHLPLEGFEVLIRPCELEFGTVEEIDHDAFFRYGRDGEAQIEDAEGSRDSRAQAVGRAPRSQEGRERQALNCRQSEEVASRTERGHPGGDYSARRTHLGIPEDAS